MTRPVRLDTLLIIFVVVIHGARNTDYLGAPVVLLAGLYLALDLGFPSPSPWLTPWLFRIRLALVAMGIFFLAVLPTATLVAFRVLEEPGSDLFITSRSMHDGALQTEEALRLVLQGKNPYAEDYAQTLVARYPMREEFRLNFNPAIYHYVYLPFTFLASVPFYLLSTGLLGWYDQRITYGFFFFLLLLLLPLMAREEEKKLGLLITIGLNPLMIGFLPVGLATGVNDYFVLALIVLALVFWQRGQFSLSALAMALAVAAKQSAWLALPLWAILVWRSLKPDKGGWAVIRPLVVLTLATTALIFPFLLWSPQDFLEDTIAYPSDSLDTSFPIWGFGLGGFLVTIGLLPSAGSDFPFWILQLAFGIPVLIYTAWRLYRRGSLGDFWLGYGALVLVVNFASRYFHTNDLSYIVALLFLGFLAESQALVGSQSEEPTISR